MIAFKGQNMNVLLTRIPYCGAGPAMICESMVAHFLTFVPHGEQTIEESEFISLR